MEKSNSIRSLSVELWIIVVALSIFTYGKTWADDWKYYGRTEKSFCFFDSKSISRPSENIVEVYEKEEYTNKGLDTIVETLGKKYENLNYLITLWQIDCMNKKSRFLSLTYYSKEKTVIYSWRVLYSSGTSEEWAPFVTDSVGERLYEAVCK